MSSRVTSRTIDALPLNGRNFVDLVALVPGARPVPEGQQGANVSFFGERGTAVSFLVDGAENNDPLQGGSALRYTQDSVREFEVVTTGYEAEFGRAQGGVVNVITRSGTNRLDGRAFWFLRDDALDASNVEGQDAPKLSRDQWGGTVGGPIKRIVRSSSDCSSGSTRPVASSIAEDSRVRAGRHRDARRRRGFLDWARNGRLHVRRQSGRLVRRVTSPECYRQRQQPGHHRRNQLAGCRHPGAPQRRRHDQQRRLGAHRTRYETLRQHHVPRIDRGLHASGLGHERRADNACGADPLLLLNPASCRPAHRSVAARIACRIGCRSASRSRSSRPGTATISSRPGGTSIASRSRGSTKSTTTSSTSAAFLFPNANDINAALFQSLGFAQSAARFFTLSNDPSGSLDLDITSNATSFFGQDTWQVTPKVTLNLGLRYDYDSLFGGDKNNISPRLGVIWDVTGSHRTLVKANWGLFFDRNVLSAAATVPEKGGIFTRNAFDVALPRLGVDYTDTLIDLVITSGFPTAAGGRGPAENPAYRTFADNLRADHLALYKLLGISVSNPAVPPVVTADNVQQLSGKTPAQALALLESTYPGTDWEFFDVPGGSILGNKVLSFFPRGPLAFSRDVSVYDEDRTPYTNGFNVGAEQQFGETFSVSAMYVHRRSHDLLTRRIVNLFDVPPGNPNFGQTTDGGQRISQVGYDGHIDYDGIVLAVRRRFVQRLPVRRVIHGIARARQPADRQRRIGIQQQQSSGDRFRPLESVGAAHLHRPTACCGCRGTSRSAASSSGEAGPPSTRAASSTSTATAWSISATRRNRATRSASKSYGDVDMRVEKQFRFGQPADQCACRSIQSAQPQQRSDVSNVSGPSLARRRHIFSGREIQLGVRYFFGQ